MKKTIFLFLITITMTSGVLAQKNSTAMDKTLALDMLQRTWEELENTVNPLTESEVNYVPKNGGWSVLNCLEHLVLVEPVLLQELEKMINVNALDTEKDLSAEDGLIISYITDRTKKVTTPKPFRPLEENKGKGKEDFLQEIKKTRLAMIELLKTTDADLRHLFGPYPYGEADAYQQFIIVAAHSHRHIMQMNEVLGELESNKTK